jgi:hypothetical protein
MPFQFLLLVKLPIRLEITARAKRAQLQHRLRTLQAPPCPGQVHAIFDQMTAGPFNHTGGNGKALLQKQIVLKKRPPIP